MCDATTLISTYAPSTLTKGSPHTLICTKNEQSYHRALNQSAKDEKLLESLRELKLG